jgi:hypothetical protein
MPNDLSRREEQRGTHKVMVWGAIVAVLIILVVMAAVFLAPAG